MKVVPEKPLPTRTKDRYQTLGEMLAARQI